MKIYKLRNQIEHVERFLSYTEYDILSRKYYIISNILFFRVINE